MNMEGVLILEDGREASLVTNPGSGCRYGDRGTFVLRVNGVVVASGDLDRLRQPNGTVRLNNGQSVAIKRERFYM